MTNSMNSAGFRVPPTTSEAKEAALKMKSDFASKIDSALKLDQTEADQDKKAGDVFVETKTENQTERITLKNGKVRCEGVETYTDVVIKGKEDSPESVTTYSSERGHCGEGGKKPVDIYKVEETKGGIISNYEAGFKADGSGHVKLTATKTDGTIVDGYQVAF